MGYKRVIFIGDSRTASAGNNLAYGNRYPLAAYAALTGTKPAYFNYAVPGMDLADIVNNYTTLIRANSRPNDIIVCNAGINDLRAGTSVATVVSLYTQLAALCLADGLQFLAVTPYPGQYTTDPANVSANAISVANQLRVLNYATSQCHPIDLPQFSTAGSRTDTNYYNLDQLHLTDLGYDGLGAYVATFIQPLIGNGYW